MRHDYSYDAVDGATDVPCACGCGREFKRAVIGGREKRFATEDCRMKWWRKHTRKILDKRPRTKRAHRGAEFQLELHHLGTINTIKRRIGAADRSATVRLLLLALEENVELLELIIEWIIGTDTITVVDTPNANDR